jgi:hypothetical protein
MFESHNRLAAKSNPATSFSGGRLGLGQRAGSPSETSLDLLDGISSEPVLRHSSLAEAMEYFELRANFLAKIRFHLEKMRDLARSNAERNVDEERSQAYHHHACTVRQIVATDYNGAPLFGRDGIVADAGDNENHLIMEGLDLSHPAIAAATHTTITSKSQAVSARELLRKALRYLTVVESSLEAHRSRLSFLNKRLELTLQD